jgi:arsenate reductase
MPTMETAKQTRNVLFLCTGNSASAGSKPVGRVNPGALELLRRGGFPTDGLRSRSWDEFAGPDAPAMDYIITVCNNAAGETCPVWPGRPATEHWDIDDPAGVGETEEGRRAAFEAAYATLEWRIRDFLDRVGR